MASPLWANYQLLSPNNALTPASGFVNIGTQFSPTGPGVTVYTITALIPAVFAASNKGLGQDGLNPLPAAAVHAGDTVTLTTLGTVVTSVLAGLIRVCG